ncbi:MAG TPA: AraC family transcriptional regulator [Verrucomicrobiae bacterium]|jgi:AraC-like DNA-binding protein|nr:AraC family transcriptional regulator [Verrucomicrobiae bacterium]
MKSETTTFYRYFPISRRDKNWGLYVTTAGESIIAPYTIYPPQGHPKDYAFDWQRGRILDEYALIYISSGSGKFETNSNFSTPIEAGHAFLLFPGVWHRYTPDQEVGWHEHWIAFDGEIVRSWLRHRFISKKSPVVSISTENALLAIFSRIMQAIRENRPALQQILGGATSGLIGLLYSSQQAQPVIDVQNATVIERAITRIQNEVERDLDMKLLAQELGVSYSRFRHRFTVHTGLSPHQYLLELRFVRARKLLAETELPIKEIAIRTGFEDVLYFSRVFRQRLNSTPSQWRDRRQRRK